jgi:hypothetical protein
MKNSITEAVAGLPVSDEAPLAGAFPPVAHKGHRPAAVGQGQKPENPTTSDSPPSPSQSQTANRKPHTLALCVCYSLKYLCGFVLAREACTASCCCCCCCCRLSFFWGLGVGNLCGLLATS